MNNKRKKTMIISIITISLLIIIVGVSYAIWIITKEQTEENVVNTACLSMNIESESDDISILKAYPISDTDGEALTPYKFSVHNKCSDMATYQINLESLSTVLEDKRLNPNYLKVKLNEVGKDGIEKILGEIDPTDTTIKNTYEAHKLMNGYLKGNETKDFELRIWMHEKVTAENADSMNKEFKSKITVTSTYLSDDDVPPTSELALTSCDNHITATATATPYKEKSISKYEYQIDEEEWQDGSETKEFNDQTEGDHTIKLRVTDNLGVVSEEVKQTINVGTSEMVEIAGKQIRVATCKNGLYKVSHSDLEELGSEWNKTEYRYAGVNYTDAETSYVHNYVSFNNELWRIIGLVNVKVGNNIEQRVKIIRTDGVNNQKAIGRYYWDTSNNNWITSKLKDMLNGIYYESGTGNCYSSDTVSQCDFNSGTDLPKGLDGTARNMIDKEVIWNLGGWSDSYITTKQFYENERGTKIYGSNPKEWSSQTDVGGKYNGIGLMYPSDFGYAVGGEARNNCLTKDLVDYSKDNCYKSDWLMPTNGYTWSLLPASSSPNCAFHVTSLGFIGNYYVYNAYGVEPTVYLTKNVTITSGEGTIDSPYQLQLNA